MTTDLVMTTATAFFSEDFIPTRETTATVAGGSRTTPGPAMLDLLYPLSEFFSHGESAPLAELEAGGERMPEPYRGLLVHDTDMTSTLAAFHGEPSTLRLVDKMHHGTDLFRQVVLVGSETGRAFEFGAIRIDLTRFEPEPRQRILEARQPLGAILAEFGITYTSHPRLFFHVTANQRMQEIFGLDGARILYGRQNILADSTGIPLAEVVEILPPIDS